MPDLDTLTPGLRPRIPKEYAERLLAARGQVGKDRRVVTVLFSDVKGSTSMAENLDPEDYVEIMEGAFDFLIAPVLRYEGTLAPLLGDAILAVFGAPIAHEDDPERACRVALDIIAGAKEYAAKLERERAIRGFNVRVGINTGLVVVGEVGSDLRVEYTAMGDTVNLASRLQSAAEPGTVLISQATHRLIAPLFETESLGPIRVKGKAESVSVFRLLSPKTVPGKVRGIPGLESPLVGRAAELAALLEALVSLQAGMGGIVTLVGEAGIGKSRLVAEARVGAIPRPQREISPRKVREISPRKVRETSLRRTDGAAQRELPLQWVEGRCLSYGTSIAYLLWLDVIRALVGVTAETSPAAVRGLLCERIQLLCPEYSDDICPYLARLMSLPLEEHEAAALRGLEGERLKAATFRAVEMLLQASAAERPLVVVCEDLHWADPTSMELLERLLGLSDRTAVAFICTLRPESEHVCWRIREIASRRYSHRHTDLWLQPFSPADSATLIDSLLSVEATDLELRERILQHAEGNPFYLEEIIRSLVDRGAIVYEEATGQWQMAEEGVDITLPQTLQGVLTARIDRLHQETRQVLRIAAVIGHTFLYRVLAAVADEEDALSGHLLALEREQMIREQARIPELEYMFRHELTRDAAYNTLLKKERLVFHRKVAEALEALFPERVEEWVALLAHHWDHAGDVEKATEYLCRAGDQARQAYAHQEAIRHYRRAQTLLEQAGTGSRERWSCIEEGLGDVRAVLAEHDEALAHYERARNLAAEASQSSERAAGLCRKTAMLYERKGQYDTAFQWLEHGLGLLASDATLEGARARLAGAGVYSRQGKHRQALEWCELGLETARQVGGQAELAHGTYLLGTIHGHLGNSAEEIACAQRSLALYQERRDLAGQAEALNNLGIAHKESGDWAAAVGYYRRGIELEECLGDVHGVAKVTNNLGNLLLWQGDLPAATQAYQTSLDIWQSIGFPIGVALSHSNLGKVCAERGEWHLALDYLERSHRQFHEIESQHFLPEVYRRLAEVYLGLNRAEEAQHHGEQSVALATELDMELEKGISLRVLGQIHLALEQWRQAEEALTASLRILEEQGNRYRMGETLYHLGRLYLAMGRSSDPAAMAEAELVLGRARAIFEELGARRNLAKVKEVLE